MNTYRTQMEQELFIHFFIEKYFVSASSDKRIKVKDYYAFLYRYEKNHLADEIKIPSRNTVNKNIGRIEVPLNYLHIKNPAFSFAQQPFWSDQTRFFYEQLDKLFSQKNDYKKLDEFEMSSEVLPLYIGLICSLGKSADNWKRIRKNSLETAERISSAISKHHISSKNTIKLSLEPSFLHIVYKYILEYFFSDAILDLLMEIESYKKSTYSPSMEGWNLFPWKQFLKSCKFYTAIGVKQFYQENLDYFKRTISQPLRKNKQGAFIPTIIPAEALIHESERIYKKINDQEHNIYEKDIKKSIDTLSMGDFVFKIQKRAFPLPKPFLML